jgi:glyoxylase-like metal-dependent hydrolase (beta-lactamase superfamily II)
MPNERGFDMKAKVTLTSLFIVVFSLTSFGQRREVKPVEFKKVTDRLFEIIGGRGAQGGMYVGDNGVLVIDAKMNKDSVEQVIKGIKQITDKPIQYLVNTHSDGDHVTGNRYFPKSVTFVAHENCRRDFFHPKRDGTASEWGNPELSPFLPSLTFRDKLDIYLGSKKVELWYFGVGHTTGDAVVYFPEEKTAFLGDQIFLQRTQLIHSYKGGNSFEHVKTLNRMLETLDAERFCSAHSEMTDRKTIKSKIGQMQERQEKVKALIIAGKNLEEVKSEFSEEQGRLIEAIYYELKPKVGPDNTVSWEEAIRIIWYGDVASVGQTHSLNVSIRMKDGTRYRTIEPNIDDVMRVIQEAGKWGTILCATE